MKTPECLSRIFPNFPDSLLLKIAQKRKTCSQLISKKH